MFKRRAVSETLRSLPPPQIRVGRSTVQPIPRGVAQSRNAASPPRSRFTVARSAALGLSVLVAMLVEDSVTLPIQINGKRRSEIKVAKDLPKDEVENLVLADDAVIKALAGGQPKKLIVVPGRIVNVVI